MLNSVTRATLLSLGLLPLSFTADAADDKNFEVAQYWRGIGEYQYVNNNTNNQGFILDALLPIYGNASAFWFLNVQGYSYDKLYRTYSVGLGHRENINNTVYGVYAFYD